ncbi:Uncharacterised protein g2669 [Pycnogonum litorale]
MASPVKRKRNVPEWLQSPLKDKRQDVGCSQDNGQRPIDYSNRGVKYLMDAKELHLYARKILVERDSEDSVDNASGSSSKIPPSCRQSGASSFESGLSAEKS